MAKDPYKYFRVEARELLDGLTQGILQLEKHGASPDLIARLLRLAHTLKGAARVVKQSRIAELAHAAEDLLTIHRENGEAVPSEGCTALLGLVDEITAQMQTLQLQQTIDPGTPRTVVAESLDTLRVEIREMDVLLRTIVEADVQLGAVRKAIGTTDRLRHLMSLLDDQLTSSTIARARPLAEELRAGLDRFRRGLAVDVARVDAELGELRAAAQRLRLVPAHAVFPLLDRAVRDAAQSLGTPVEFETSGGDVRLDAAVLSSLRDALMHVVRNAIAHGNETEGERQATGKPPTRRVRLQVGRRGRWVVFSCQDDGKGIDIEAVRHVAVARGLLPAADAQALPADQVIALLGTGGLSTSGGVTELSGRGVGMDVVRTTAAMLKGEVHIHSEPRRGATVEILVPVSIASLEGLVVEAAGRLVTIPLDAVRETRRVRDADIARSADRDSIVQDGAAIPFVRLDRVLQRSASRYGARPGIQTAVIIHGAGKTVALGVDRLLGTSHIVLRPLPAVVDADAVVFGASLDADGNPQLVLDPSGLAAAVEGDRGLVRESTTTTQTPILVVDDSLTTRMLEQSILESAGYTVDLAVSAEDALTKVGDRRYGLFIVDVDMPGMDGFEFVAHTRQDAALRDIPAILVTSRSAAEDKLRGEQVGARAYIVKSEFDQGHLLQTIRRLIA